MSIAEMPSVSDESVLDDPIEVYQKQSLSDVLRRVRQEGATLMSGTGTAIRFMANSGDAMQSLIEDAIPALQVHNPNVKVLAQTNNPVAKTVATMRQLEWLSDIEMDLETGADRKVTLSSLQHLAPVVREKLLALKKRHGALLRIETRDQKVAQEWNQLKQSTQEQNLRTKLEEAARTNQRLKLPLSKELSHESCQLLWRLKAQYGDRFILDFQSPQAEKSWKKWMHNGEEEQEVPVVERVVEREEPKKQSWLTKAACTAKGWLGRFGRK